MRRRKQDNDENDGSVHHGTGANWLAKVVFVCLVIFVVGAFVGSYIESGSPPVGVVLYELFRRLLVGVPILILGRPGISAGLRLSHLVLSVRREPHTEERRSAQKTYLIELVKREGFWYLIGVGSLLFVYPWTPFAGRWEIFFILTIAVPLGLFITVFIGRILGSVGK